MTKEDAIKGLKENLCSLCAYGSQNMDSCDIKGCDNRDYINALEQQTNDCKIFGTKENCFGGATENECEHCDYKIQKLEQYPSDDCVSRKQALLQLTGVNLSDKTTEELIGLFGRRINELPPVIPTQSWIPVSERLPEEETDVLICNANKEIAISRGSYSTEIENTFIWYTSGWRFGEVIAWQPLPKPYEEKRGSEDESIT